MYKIQFYCKQVTVIRDTKMSYKTEIKHSEQLYGTQTIYLFYENNKQRYSNYKKYQVSSEL